MLRGLCGGLILGVVLSGLLFAVSGRDLLSLAGLGVPCPLHAITGLVCPGCGMTRALLLVGQLQWGAALAQNPLVFLLLGIAAVLLWKPNAAQAEPTVAGTAARTARTARWPTRLTVPALALVLLHWVHALAT